MAAVQSSESNCGIIVGARRGWFEVVVPPQPPSPPPPPFPETADLLGFLLKLFQHLVESVPQRTVAVLRANREALPGIGVVFLIKCSVRAAVYTTVYNGLS